MNTIPSKITKQAFDNMKCVLEAFDSVEIKRGIKSSISIFISMAAVFLLSVTNSTTFLGIYIGLNFVFVLITISIWGAYMDVDKIHYYKEKFNLDKKSLSQIYSTIIGSYKSIGFVVFSIIIEVYWIISYMDNYIIAGIWTIVSLIPSWFAHKYRTKYDNIKTIYNHALQNS